MKHLFVPYDLALKLKKKGFDEPCLYSYCEKINFNTKTGGDILTGEFHLRTDSNPFGDFYNGKNWNDITGSNKHKIICSAPLFQQVIDWFRDKYHIHIEIRTMGASNIHGLRKEGKEIFYQYWIHDLREKHWNRGETTSNEYFYYYETLNKAIEKSFKLI